MFRYVHVTGAAIKNKEQKVNRRVCVRRKVKSTLLTGASLVCFKAVCLLKLFEIIIQVIIKVITLFLVMWIICYHRALTDVFFLRNKFNFFPEVIVYYKTLTLLWVKKDEEDFLVAGESLRNFVAL